MIDIRQVETRDEIHRVRELLIEYADWVRREVDKVEDLSTVVSFTNHEAEMEGLPGIYGPPDGRLLLATEDNQSAGCGALKNLGEGNCEIKRVYIRPAFRGKGIGRELVGRLIHEAQQLGYRSIYLDTHVDLKAAQQLYHSFGFKQIDAYFSADEEFLAIAVFMKLDLTG